MLVPLLKHEIENDSITNFRLFVYTLYLTYKNNKKSYIDLANK